MSNACMNYADSGLPCSHLKSKIRRCTKAKGNIVSKMSIATRTKAKTNVSKERKKTSLDNFDLSKNLDRFVSHFSVSKLLTALPKLLKQTAAATPIYPKHAAQDGHCASIGGP